jgi:phenylpropionate dioxygenase-like ring-hydroxylating dioxygenase large terminal subunit
VTLIPPEPTTDARKSAYTFPLCPASWYYFCSVERLRHGPVSLRLSSDSFVAYQATSGKVAVLDSRCSHARSDLAKGCVKGENLQCPLHGWEYNTEGVCVRIPTSKMIPRWAGQKYYPVEIVAGHVFFFNRVQASFPLPCFEESDWGDLVSAEPLAFEANAPWHIITSNGFDLQHFHCSHDRHLMDEPVVDSPSPIARRIVANFSVSGKSWRDALTRSFCGPRVQMSMTVWCGNLVFVSAKFRRTTSYGLISTVPVDADRSAARVIVFVPKSKGGWGRKLIDPIDARIRRSFIRRFLQSDVERIAGLKFSPSRLIDADRTLREYLEWLEKIHH